MSVFTMPSLGADMEAGTLVEWLVGPGDTVSRGDIVAVVETQKGAIEIEIFEEGVVRKLEAELGQTLPVGAPLAVIGRAEEPGPPAPEAGEAKPATAAPEAPAPGIAVEAAQVPTASELSARPAPSARKATSKDAATIPREDATSAGTATAQTETSGPTLSAVPRGGPAPAAPDDAPPASPAARSIAAERGIELRGLAGSGPSGAIVLADVERAAGAAASPRPMPAHAPSPGNRPGLDFAAMREAIAAAMARSKREIPHYYLAHEIDLQSATDWLQARNAERGPQDRLLMGALFVRATALAAAETPGLSGQYADGRFAAGQTVNVGVAVALRGGGLVAPAIRDSVGRSLDEVMNAMRDLVTRARAGRLRSSEMTDGTITISALGEKGVDSMTGVIYPPQVALVGFGTPRPVARVLDEAVAVRSCVTVTLAADHRVSDGRRGAQFLQKLEAYLNQPEAL